MMTVTGRALIVAAGFMGHVPDAALEQLMLYDAGEERR